jgi:hypothetical protein
VNVGVAARASRLDPGEADHADAVRSFVAGAAGGIGVNALQREGGAGMVEPHLVPGVDVVAAPATCRLAVPFPAMRVDVAAGTGLVLEAEAPPLGGKKGLAIGGVAQVAGDGAMCSLEGGPRRRVIGKGEVGRLEPLHGVAPLAGAPVGAVDELAAMIIDVAIGAAVERQRRARARAGARPLSVAGRAGNVAVTTLEGVSGAAVVEVGHAEVVPSPLVVAGGARSGQGPAMRIAMTGRAVRERDPHERDGIPVGGMALRTRHLPVLTTKGKPGADVIEAGGRVPRRLLMASLASRSGCGW